MAECEMAGCHGRTVARGYCRKHYNRLMRHGRLSRVAREPYPAGSTCAVDGCESPVRAQGWCSTHYSRVQATGELGPAAPIHQKDRNLPRKYEGVACKIEGCERQAVARTMCRKHYERMRPRAGETW